jgi:hypothetical protein
MSKKNNAAFYIGKSGTYGDVRVARLDRRHKDRDVSFVDITYKGKDIFHANLEEGYLALCRDSEVGVEEVEIINEALRQMDDYRVLMIVSVRGNWTMIVDGQKIPFVQGLEIRMGKDAFYTAIPWRPKGHNYTKESVDTDRLVKKFTPRRTGRHG